LFVLDECVEDLDDVHGAIEQTRVVGEAGGDGLGLGQVEDVGRARRGGEGDPHRRIEEPEL
jgi:hypothetical protein